MKKTVFTMRDVDRLIANGEKKLKMDSSCILTPSVKDYLKTKGIELQWTNASPDAPVPSDTLLQKVSTLVVQKFQISNPKLAADIIEAVIKQIK